jgi:hypothetical protein
MKSTKLRRILVALPETVLKDVVWLAPLEDMTRDELITEAVRRFLKPHLKIRARISRISAKPGKTYVPFDTHEEFIAALHSDVKKLRLKDAKRKAKRGSSGLSKALRAVQKSAKHAGSDKLTAKDIDAEVTAVRQRPRITKAISKSTDQFKTGKYEE